MLLLKISVNPDSGSLMSTSHRVSEDEAICLSSQSKLEQPVLENTNVYSIYLWGLQVSAARVQVSAPWNPELTGMGSDIMIV